MEREKMKKNLQTRYVLGWLARYFIKFYKVYIGTWGYFGSQEGAKTGTQMSKNRHVFKKKRIERINNQGPFFFSDSNDEIRI